jgi:hypothetical protein
MGVTLVDFALFSLLILPRITKNSNAKRNEYIETSPKKFKDSSPAYIIYNKIQTNDILRQNNPIQQKTHIP